MQKIQTMAYPTLRLKPKKEISIARRHPWVFSGALVHQTEKLTDGTKVHLANANGQVIATGHYGRGSIAMRVLHFGETALDVQFYTAKLAAARQLRADISLPHAGTNGYRLVHGEGDGLPGLVIDVYADVAVMQSHSAGMEADAAAIAEALKAVFGSDMAHVVHKSVASKGQFTLPEGTPGTAIFSENGHRFVANWEKGQKTGFFLDQRENRELIGRYSDGRKVLNAFCYTGGFSVYALAAGAAEVHSLDSSQNALELVDEHISLNKLEAGRHHNIQADALDYLSSPEAREAGYDLIVLDPPAFAKHRSARHAAVQAYKRINAKAMQFAKSGSILFTFSCSQVVDKALFNHTIAAAAMESGRSVRILHQLHQPADHPVSIYHPEGEYLKGLVLRID